MAKITVLGSINIDMVMETDRFPRVGETIMGNTMYYFMGGKGSNQAVAAARAGAAVSLRASVGGDTFGEKALAHLKDEGIDTTGISVVDNIFTGTASIFRIQRDNAIVVLPGANMLQKPLASESLTKDEILLTQLEIPLDSVRESLAAAKAKGITTILNPAPFNAAIVEMLDDIDIVTPNETEFEGMVGHPVADADIEVEMLKWAKSHDTRLIVTRGGQGVSFVEGDTVVTIPTIDVEVLDTTGAGDTFNGSLAAFLATGTDFAEAVRQASIYASISTTKLGAQTGMPTPEEVAEFLS